METPQIVRRETWISTLINAAISAAMYALVFGFLTPAAVKGLTGYANDFFPQIFMVSLMACLVPGLLTMRRHRANVRFLRLGGAIALVALSLLVAMCATALIGGALALSFHRFAPAFLPSLPALAFKVLVGALVASATTNMSVRYILTQAMREDRQIG